MGRSIVVSIGRLLAAGILAASLFGVASARPATHAATRVTIFGDSVADVLDYVPAAKQYLEQGLDVNWELKVCRRLVSLSCPYEGARPPTVLDVVNAAAQGELGSIVVVDVGYNDYVDQYKDDMDTVVRALLAKGVQQIIWTTLHEVRDDYRRMNAAIRVEAASRPQVSVADFNAASLGQSWFNSDGIHMNDVGAWGLAKLLRPAILAACGQPCQPPPTPAVPVRTLVIRAGASAVRIGAFTVWKPPVRRTYQQAVAAFGRASTCRLLAGNKSRVVWSGLGLSMQFIAVQGQACSNPATMQLQTLSATGSRWKTSKGLSIGDPLAKLERLYPSATRRAGSYWLLKVDRGRDHALLSAAVRASRVRAFQLAVRADS